MGLRKCPRCELNYIRDDEKLCNVCRRAAKHEEEPEEEIMCAECGEHPAMKGKELCAECWKESLREQKLQNQRKAAMDGMEYGGVDDVALPDEEIPTGNLPDDIAEEFEDDAKEQGEPEEGEIEFTKGESLEELEEKEADEYDEDDFEYEDGETPVRKKHR